MKAGKTPEAWEKNQAKNRQKDKDARYNLHGLVAHWAEAAAAGWLATLTAREN